jgi:arginase
VKAPFAYRRFRPLKNLSDTTNQAQTSTLTHLYAATEAVFCWPANGTIPLMQKWPELPTTLIGVPLDLGAKNLGVDQGPATFRTQGIIDKLSKAGMHIEDHGDILPRRREELDPGDHRLRYADEIVRVSEAVAQKTNDSISQGKKVIAVGGDHSLNLGVVAGASAALHGNIGLIYLDAHGDMNTPDITLSGNIHGMHLAALVGHSDPKLVNVHAPGAKIQVENLLHIGGNDFDDAELAFMNSLGVPMFTLFDLLTHNLAPLLAMIDELCKKVDNIWISLDLDVIDRVYAPGAGMPNPGGLSYREIAAIATYIGEKCNVVGIDVVEYNPLQDENYKTAELGIELIAKFFGRQYSWYTGYMEANQL